MAKLTILDIISPNHLLAAVETLPPADKDRVIGIAMGMALEAGEVTVPDGDDLPPRLRAANRKRIDALPPDERAAMLGLN